MVETLIIVFNFFLSRSFIAFGSSNSVCDAFLTWDMLFVIISPMVMVLNTFLRSLEKELLNQNVTRL